MYTGQLINDLMAVVERVGQDAQRRRTEHERQEQEELHAIFAMQIPVTASDQVFMGAA
ncbi:MAG: hypothetical protein ABSG72_13895 [Candidatus Sulfotelmatobacter sp.]|jgi:hypothetical protein